MIVEPAPPLRLDHLVFAAADLAAGREAMAGRLGVAPQGGGAHPGMGTHNALWRLGEAYLEVLAIDPAAPPPGRPRMFGLDHPANAARLGPEPVLLAWVAATDDLDAALARAPLDLGEALPLGRGDLRWRLTVTKDGPTPLNGLAPALIEWPAGVHPAAAMADSGLRLRRFEARTPEPQAVSAALAALGAEALIAVREGPAGLRAEIDTPRGPVAFG